MFGRALFFSMLEAFSLFPVFLWLNALLFNGVFEGERLLLYFLIYPLATALSYMHHHLVSRIVYTIGILALYAAMIDFSSRAVMLSVGLFIAIAVQRGFLYRLSDAEAVFPRTLMWTVSLPSYFVSYFFFQSSTLEDWLVGSAIILIVGLLLLTNHEHLQAKDRHHAHQKSMLTTIKRQNSLYLFVIVIGIFLLVRYNVVAAGIVFLLRQLFYLLGQGEPTEAPPEESMGPVAMDLSNIEVKDPSLFAQIMDKVLEILAIGIFSVVILFLIYVLLKRLPGIGKKIERVVVRLYHVLFHRRFRTTDVSTAAFEDETQQVFQWQAWLNKRKNSWKKADKTVNWRELDVNSQVRYLFRQLVEKGTAMGLDYRKSQTAAEYVSMMPDELFDQDDWQSHVTELYQLARYSKHDSQSVVSYLEQLERHH
ncbi:hypothetical protein HMI01_05710 [Halolactibacillus miurensis]|uniref:DUF4129 domain-containing protein n=1 Tax=Halolactibacillus miurensis TaxID=306541 RepID=A0A1I6R4C7_9BACI|nr:MULTISPECIES: DUF4129 domain-containing protein [Halolactibacillus]GEM03583.1 hypothetical protein HMI01_05710 [Halolactibacillus miurensis]SFS59474.1 hypothetical protein SAMN05421668_105104 [Halolactibacillus miurensis]